MAPFDAAPAIVSNERTFSAPVASPMRSSFDMDAGSQVEGFREATGALKVLSFDTIAGAASNGAIVHYRPTARLNKRAEQGSLLLVDSGAQYLDGTTDVTRTVAI